MTSLKISDFPFARNFNVVKPTVLCQKNSKTLVISYNDEWKGRKYFKIQEIWVADEYWQPGKLINIPLELKDEFLNNLVDLLVVTS